MQVTARFAASLHSPAAARRFVGRALEGRQGLSQDDRDAALLLVSELVTNAVVHAHSAVEVSVRVDNGTLRIAVRDQDPTVPVRRAADDGGGFGLWLLEELTQACGVQVGGSAKTVWFSLAPRSRAGRTYVRGTNGETTAKDGPVSAAAGAG